MSKFLILVFILTFSAHIIYGQNAGAKPSAPISTTVNQQISRGNGMRFTENKGQVADKEHNLRPDILFNGQGAAADIYLRNTGMSYVFSNMGHLLDEVHEKIEEMEKTGEVTETNENEKERELLKKEKLTIHRVDMDFIGGNENAPIARNEELEGYDNYYYAHCPQGVTNVKSYNMVIRKNIYQNIDVKYYGNRSDGIKYDLIVNPNGDPTLIQLSWKGAEEMHLNKDGNLVIKTSVNEFTESIPEVYQLIEGKKIFIKAKYELNQKNETSKATREAGELEVSITSEYIVSFKLGKYNHNYPLIIDPATWITYFGGSNSDMAISVTTDNKGDAIFSGNTVSIDLPISAGAWQSSTEGATDVFIVKMSNAGGRLFSTYLGGTSEDKGAGIDANSQNEIYLTGITFSSNFPVQTWGNAYMQPTPPSGGDAFIAKFSNAGTLIWSTFFGGTGKDLLTEMIIDSNDDIIIGGETGSTDFPNLQSAQGNLKGGYDLVVSKFNNSGALQWSSFYGGDSYEYAGGLTVDGSNNIYVGGGSGSSDFPTTGLIKPKKANVYDGFLLRLSPVDGSIEWSTYIGSDQGSPGRRVAADGLGNIFFLVVTAAKDLGTPGTFRPNLPVDFGLALLKFTNKGIPQWGTYLYSSAFLKGGDEGNGLAVDERNNIVVAGDTYGEDFTVTDCAYKSIFKGTENQFVSTFDQQGRIICSGFVSEGYPGSQNNETGGAVFEIDANAIAVAGGFVYLAAASVCTYPVTPGAFQTQCTGGFDAVLSKLCTYTCGLPRTIADFTSNNNVCPGQGINFTLINTSCDTLNTTYQWNFAGAITSSSVVKNPLGIKWTSPGKYTVSVKVMSPCDTFLLEKLEYVTIKDCPETSTCSDNSKRVNIWYFGNKAGLDFNSGSPVSLSNSAMDTPEGCSSISDVNGNLLFYTNGENIWNKIHSPMTNGTGLLGHMSSTQSVIIIPKPGSTTNYYVFTSDANENLGNNGYRYSEVDMTMDGGNGGVILSSKNTLLSSPSTEKLTAVAHSNGCDTWVITHPFNSNEFRAYLVTKNGVSAPKVSSIGTLITSATGGIQMKASPDGKKLVCNVSNVEVFNFNNSTGEVSNLATINIFNPYGVEFSNDNKLLYITSASPALIHQIDLATNSIISQIPLQTEAWILQKGPDKKIYYSPFVPTVGNVKYLGAINKPDVPGIGCDVVENAVPLTSNVSYGLPSFINSYFQIANLEITDSIDCRKFIFASSSTIDSASYFWDFGDISSNNNSSVDANPVHDYTKAGTYSVTLTVQHDCQCKTITKVVAVKDCNCLKPNSKIRSSTLSICSGTGIAKLTGTSNPEAMYEWYKDGSLQKVGQMNDSVYTATSQGSYQVRISLNGCDSLSAPIQITETVIDLSTTFSNSSCGSNDGIATVTAGGGLAPYTYSWNTRPVQINPKAVNLAVGTYAVTVKDQNNCSNTAKVSISNEGEPKIKIVDSTNIKCHGASTGAIDLKVLSGPGPYTYKWSNGTTTEDITNVRAGFYSVVVTDQNGCKASAGATITEPDTILLTSTITNVKCHGASTGSININVSGGSFPYVYSWSTGIKTEDLNNLSAGSYSVNVFDANSCKVSKAFSIGETSTILLTTSTTTSTCKSLDGTATANASGGTTPYSYSWNTTPVQTTKTASNLPAGNYTVTVKDANNCTVIAIASVSDSPEPTISLKSSADILCSGKSTGYIKVVAKGKKPLIYQWNIGSSSDSIYNLRAGDYSVTVTDSNGCVASLNKTLQEAVPLITNLTKQDAGCTSATGSTSISVSGGTNPYQYNWSSGSTISTANNLNPGNYTVTVTDNNGCTVTKSFSILNNPKPTVSANPQTICYGEQSILVAQSSTGTSYLWSTGDTTQRITIKPASAGTFPFWVKAISTGCASDSATVNLKVNPRPDFSFTEKNLITCFLDGPITIISPLKNGYIKKWLPTNESKDSISVSNEGVYTLTVKNQYQCSFSDKVKVINNCEPKLFVPNAISPNGDGTNDSLAVFYRYVKDFEIMIFNRWGEMVYKEKFAGTGNNTQGKGQNTWDGNYLNTPAPFETYPYVIKYNSSIPNDRKNPRTKRGSVTVVR